MRNIPWLQSRRATVLVSHHATTRLATTSKGHRLFRRTWKRANQTDPTGEARPTEYGWKENNNRLEPDRFPGRSVPETLGATRRNDDTTRMDNDASHIGDVSTHADDERTERMTLMTTLTTWKWWRQHPRTTNSRVPGERTEMTVPTKIRRATFEDVKTYKHTSIKHTKSQKA